MSTQLTGASAKVLFESPAQLNLKKKLLQEGGFEIVSSGPESATNLDKGITIVRTKQEVGRDALTDEPIYEFKEFPIQHPRENIADVLKRRLPRDEKGLLTIPGIAEADMDEVNAGLEEFGVYLEPEEFTVTKQGEAAFSIIAKNPCVIFYGKITVTNTAASTDPLEVYEAEGGEGEAPSNPSEGEGSEGSESGNSEGNVAPPAELKLVATLEGTAIDGKAYQTLNVSFDGVTEKSTAGVIRLKDSSNNVVAELAGKQLPTAELIEMTFPAGAVTVTFLVDGKTYTAAATAQAVTIPSPTE